MYSFSVGPPGDTEFQSPTYKKQISNHENKENLPMTSMQVSISSCESPLKNMQLSGHLDNPLLHLAKHGRIQLICGPMFSGKSTELLRKMRVFEVALHKSLIIKYAKDNRFSKECLSTHDRVMRKAVQATKLEEVRKEAEGCTIIGIDEGQFFEDVVEFSVDMANRGKIVIIAALDGDFQQKPFMSIIELIPNCESVVKLSSVCMSCLKQASFTKRLNEDTRVEVIGHNDMYAASCRRCLLLPTSAFKQQLEIRSELKRSQSQDSLSGIAVCKDKIQADAAQRKLDF